MAEWDRAIGIGKQLRIVADDPVRDALRQALKTAWGKGIPFSTAPPEAPLQTGEIVMVYAHALCGGVTQRADFGGLACLEKLLTHPFSQRCTVLILGWLSPLSYSCFNYLTDSRLGFHYQRLPICFSSLCYTTSSEDRWRFLQERAQKLSHRVSVGHTLDLFASHKRTKLREDPYWASAKQRLQFARSIPLTPFQLLDPTNNGLQLDVWADQLLLRLKENLSVIQVAGVDGDFEGMLNQIHQEGLNYAKALKRIRQLPEESQSVSSVPFAEALSDALNAIETVRQIMREFIQTINTWDDAQEE